MAICPHCDSRITNLTLEEVTSSVFMGTQWKTIVYVCPHCKKIISAQIDPIAIKADTINAIKRN